MDTDEWGAALLAIVYFALIALFCLAAIRNIYRAIRYKSWKIFVVFCLDIVILTILLLQAV